VLEVAGPIGRRLARAVRGPAAAPTRLPTGTVRWLARPAEYDWRPGDPLAVQRAAARMLQDDRQPRQVWQLNRAAIPTVE
jgi:hypothetical protein